MNHESESMFHNGRYYVLHELTSSEQKNKTKSVNVFKKLLSVKPDRWVKIKLKNSLILHYKKNMLLLFHYVFLDNFNELLSTKHMLTRQ